MYNVVFVTDSWTQDDLINGRLLSGRYGRMLDWLLSEARIYRHNIQTLAMFPRVVQHSELFTDKKGTKPTDKLLQASYNIREECRNYKVVVCLGPVAAYAMLDKPVLMSNYHGSVFKVGEQIVLLSYHPEYLCRAFSTIENMTAINDIKKLHTIMQPEYSVPQWHTANVTTTLTSALALVTKMTQFQGRISFDIETEYHQIQCIGFAFGDESHVIPFYFEEREYWTESEELSIWQALKTLFESGKKFIAHNAMFDTTYLWYRYGITTNSIEMDTMLAHHDCFPDMEKSLGVCTALYTHFPYYKSMRNTESADERWQYCAQDCQVTLAIANVLDNVLAERRMTDFYNTKTNTLIRPLVELQCNGIAIDHAYRLRLISDYEQQIIELRKDICSLTEQPGFNPASPKQLYSFFYGQHKYAFHFTGKGEARRVTCDEDALHAFAKQRKQHHKLIDALLQFRKLTKLVSTYLDIKFDDDNKLRGSYIIGGTQSGRLASKASNWDTGTNMQNSPRTLRRMLIASPGHVLINADLAQAEVYVTAYTARVKQLIDAFARGTDIHALTGALIYLKDGSDEAVARIKADDEAGILVDGKNTARQNAKKCNHALNYGMGERLFAQEIDKPLEEARALREAWYSAFPEIRRWHYNVERLLKSKQEFVTCLGRRRIFYEADKGAVLHSAISYAPQSTVGDLALIGLRRFWESAQGTCAKMILTMHDSLVVEVPDIQPVIQRISTLLVRAMSIPLTIGGMQFTIPVDVKYGFNMEQMNKIKVTI